MVLIEERENFITPHHISLNGRTKGKFERILSLSLVPNANNEDVS